MPEDGPTESESEAIKQIAKLGTALQELVDHMTDARCIEVQIIVHPLEGGEEISLWKTYWPFGPIRSREIQA